ncbi:hypothetical protein BDV93DRAFT_342358 [Ceratobasidium sp. AG-I]|nr:hypothetical protein BDV93DRAFT_342358 [Ceratobasidium sp. AG-I]
MDASNTHDFSAADFSFLPPNDPEQFLQFPPNSPSAHPFSFGDAPLPAYPAPYAFNAPAPQVPASHGVMDTTGSTPSPRPAFVPASPMTPPLTSLSGSEISGDNLSQGHGWTTTSATPGGRSGYNSGYNSASGYVSGGAGSRSGTGSPGSSNSHSFPGYGNGLVHRSSRGIYTRGMAERSAHKRRGSTSMRMADEDSYGSDGESELGLNMPTDVVVSRRREEIRRQRIESEQRRRDDLREGFARLKDVLPVSNQKGSKMALLDRATSHVRYLEAMQQQMQSKLTASEMEVNRLRQINEALMLKAAERRSSQSPL